MNILRPIEFNMYSTVTVFLCLFLLVASSEAFLSLQKRCVTLSESISGVISPLFAYSQIDDSYYFISLARGLLSFESLSHGTHLTILITTDCGDFISYTCIISDVVLDHDKKDTVTSIGGKIYNTIYYIKRVYR